MDYKMLSKQVNGERFEVATYGSLEHLKMVQYFSDGYFDVLTGTPVVLIQHLAKRYGVVEATLIVAAALEMKMQ